MATLSLPDKAMPPLPDRAMPPPPDNPDVASNDGPPGGSRCRDRAVRAAGRQVLDALHDPRYAHTSHLQVRLDGYVVVDEHLRGPLVADVFSVTKSVVSTALGVMAQQGSLPNLDEAVTAVLPRLRGTPADAHTWRHLLTMTRGATVDGAWDVDAVTALPGGQVQHIAHAPQLTPPGARFTYDNGAWHLLTAAASGVLGESLADFAGRELFAPLGIEEYAWAHDPDGVPFGYGHLRLSADAVATIGQLWLSGGRWRGRAVVSVEYLARMVRPHTAGGPPENMAYGLGVWVDGDVWLAGGWAGQHLLCIPSAGALVVTTGWSGFDPGPPPRDDLPDDWAPAVQLVRAHLVPTLLATTCPLGRPHGCDWPGR